MILRSLATRNFRNLQDSQTRFDPRANVILGENGQGKTNLLEAIYFLGTTKSFRTPRAGTLMRLGARSLFVEGEVEEESITRKISVGVLGADERKRQALVNAQKTPLAPYLQVMPIVAYSAARLEIIRGGPDERRRFLDRGIAALRVTYLREVSRYMRVVRQRNALLQRVSEGSEKKASLDAWDEELVEAALPIVAAREQYMLELQTALSDLLDAYAPSLRGLRMDYRPAGVSGSVEESLARVRSLRARELGAGFTLSGPHRDAMELSLRNVGAADLLSSGEIKLLTLLLKSAKLQIFRQQAQRLPVFLLDDIDAELDLAVMQRLLSSLLASGQFFTSSAKASVFRLLEVGPHRRFLVRDGRVSEDR